MIPAVVIAAGLGTRLRPLTERYAKPVLPLDGQPVIARLLRDLAGGGCARVTVVTGHLAEQVESLLGDGSGFGVDVRYVRQPEPAGSADAVRRAGERPPYLVAAADTVFPSGSIARVAGAALPAGAIAVRRLQHRVPVRVRDGLVERVSDTGGPGPLSGAPLWVVGPEVHERLCLDNRPWELGKAFQAAIDEGKQIAAVEIGATRDLTTPIDLLEHNFPYLGSL
ncbi:MAG TPA: sugar phosphate nucleotidyltransferase [Gaiellaceae bacterium]|nr:sugar phosphate nucleotidyltransferase [Gaiellaceae bacterium]